MNQSQSQGNEASRSKTNDLLTKHFEFMQGGAAIANALLDDYAQTMSKIEGSSPDVVRKRVIEATNERLKSIRDDLNK